MNAKQPLSALTVAVGLALCAVAQADELPQLAVDSSAANVTHAANEVLSKQSRIVENSPSASFASSATTQDVSASSPDWVKPTADSSSLVAMNDSAVSVIKQSGVDAPAAQTRQIAQIVQTDAVPASVSATIAGKAMTAEPQTAQAMNVTEAVTETTAVASAENAADAATDTTTGNSTDTANDTADVMDEEFADPYERMNRNVYAFNDVVDKAAVKPVAKGYKKLIPEGPRLCASNMFSNLGEPYTAVNNLLQGKPKAMLQDIGRLLLNSTLGIGGCVDVASAWGIPKHQEDFGQTLAVWGVPSGPYVVLPVLGPSTVRDALSKPVDFLANPIGYVTNVPLRNSLQGYKMLDTRTNLLEASDVVDQSALDPYVMVRDAWLQRRLAQIKDEDGSYNERNDGNVPRKLELAPRSAVIQ